MAILMPTNSIIADINVVRSDGVLLLAYTVMIVGID